MEISTVKYPRRTHVGFTSLDLVVLSPAPVKSIIRIPWVRIDSLGHQSRTVQVSIWFGAIGIHDRPVTLTRGLHCDNRQPEPPQADCHIGSKFLTVPENTVLHACIRCNKAVERAALQWVFDDIFPAHPRGRPFHSIKILSPLRTHLSVLIISLLGSFAQSSPQLALTPATSYSKHSSAKHLASTGPSFEDVCTPQMCFTPVNIYAQIIYFTCTNAAPRQHQVPCQRACLPVKESTILHSSKSRIPTRATMFAMLSYISRLVI